MTQDQLRAFIAVVETGAFGRAAKRLAKSQPAVSKLVKHLEDELGLSLLDRTGYRPVATHAGRLVYERAVTIVLATEELSSFSAQLAQPTEAVLRIAIEGIAPLSPVLQSLELLQSRFPTTRIEMTTCAMGAAIHRVREREADLAISSATRPYRGLESRGFRSVRVLPVVHRDHPMASTQGPVPRALLAQTPQVVLGDDAPDDAAINLLPNGLRWNVTDVASKRAIILAKMGWGGLPEHVVRDDLKAGRLVALDVEDFKTTAIGLSLVRRQRSSHGPAAQTLWARLAASSV